MERQKAVIDASVAAKWFLDEEYSAEARMVRDAYVAGSLGITVPSLFFYETLNALRYSREYKEAELGTAAVSLSKYGLDVWPPSGAIYRNTATLSVKHDVSVYDASYLALAQHLRIPFYTADDKLLRKFPGSARHLRSFK